ncbi:MAG TPA: hypothetical protein VN868_08670 [Terriglobales bacterium]|nr:hypothetical protein [Terriglobales bacterium]
MVGGTVYTDRLEDDRSGPSRPAAFWIQGMHTVRDVEQVHSLPES